METPTTQAKSTPQGQAQFWKILTHDFRPPLQGGQPLFDGRTFPFKLNGVTLDTSDEQCASGWNFVDSIETGFQIAGMWPTGRPSQVLLVDPSKNKIQRGNKWRCSVLTLERFATTDEINSAIERFSQVFKGHAEEMAKEQILWREALARPLFDKNIVTKSLEIAIHARGLKWELKEYKDAWDARAARDARDAWDARDARDARAARDAWDAWDARAAWDAWDARAARDAWDARAARAAWYAWYARAAWDARAALTVNYASLQKWITHPNDLLTKGIRDAYLNGLEIAIPVGKDTLGFAMKEQ